MGRSRRFHREQKKSRASQARWDNGRQCAFADAAWLAATVNEHVVIAAEFLNLQTYPEANKNGGGLSLPLHEHVWTN